ncbi:hypothetical protein J2S74_002227 [Evansella vedderi]|uniref:Uncharacterized protein n=1 Tax=Evansella vedderi TaxID=38282 RepID=A0ABT9ZUD5_9BACI|nr:hypothetical protein [Evansella vedderi]MDQ0254848.1 hypothetical protein [Evansella vedderi]
MGKRISDKSSNISYFFLVIFILAAVIGDRLLNGTVNIFLLILLGLSMVIHPIMTFLIAQKYQFNNNFYLKISNFCEKVDHKYLIKKRKRRLLFIMGLCIGAFVLPPLFGNSGPFHDLLNFLFGEPGEGKSPLPLLFTLVLIAAIFLGFNVYSKKAKESDDIN